MALTLVVFVYRPQSTQRSDAVVVLGGSGAGPFDKGVALAKEGYAPTRAFSLIPST